MTRLSLRDKRLFEISELEITGVICFTNVLFAFIAGIIAGVGIFGPAIAFSLGGVFSRIYVTLEGKYTIM